MSRVPAKVQAAVNLLLGKEPPVLKFPDNTANPLSHESLTSFVAEVKDLYRDPDPISFHIDTSGSMSSKFQHDDIVIVRNTKSAHLAEVVGKTVRIVSIRICKTGYEYMVTPVQDGSGYFAPFTDDNLEMVKGA